MIICIYTDLLWFPINKIYILKKIYYFENKNRSDFKRFIYIYVYIYMLKSKLVNDFEYCTNEVSKLMLLEGIPTLVGLYILYIMSSEWTNGSCFDSLQLTVMILTILYIVYCIVVEFYLFSISILTLLQDCRNHWFFLQSLLFGKNAHRKGIGGINGRTGERPRKMGPCGVARMGVKIFVFVLISIMIYDPWHVNVKWPLLQCLCLYYRSGKCS